MTSDGMRLNGGAVHLLRALTPAVTCRPRDLSTQIGG